jgi:hypothetical protein
VKRLDVHGLPVLPGDRTDCDHFDACRRLALFPKKRWGFEAEWKGCRAGCELYQNKAGGK